jgi:hypothetical protein
MSVNFETLPSTNKVFWFIFLFLSITLSTLYFVVRFIFDNDFKFTYGPSYSLIFASIINPVFIAFLSNRNASKCKLSITDFHTVANFNEKLLERVRAFNMLEKNDNDLFIFTPKSFFRKLNNNMFGTEILTVEFKENIVTIYGPLYRVSQIQDTLTWNKDFK